MLDLRFALAQRPDAFCDKILDLLIQPEDLIEIPRHLSRQDSAVRGYIANRHLGHGRLPENFSGMAESAPAGEQGCVAPSQAQPHWALD